MGPMVTTSTDRSPNTAPRNGMCLSRTRTWPRKRHRRMVVETARIPRLLYSRAMERRALRLMAPFHSVFYAPQFVAIHRGFFAEEGLDLTGEPAPGGSRPT